MATVTWVKSNSSGDWTTGADWSTGSPPGPGDDAVITNGGTVSITSSVAVNSITVSAGIPYGNTNYLGIAVPGGNLSVSGDFMGTGNVGVDVTSGQGGTTIDIGGTLGRGFRRIGNDALNAPTTVIAGNLSGFVGGYLIGNITSGTTNQATLNVKATAPSTFAFGTLFIEGDALLEFASGQITDISLGGLVELQGAQARIGVASDTSTNSALIGLTSNGGGLALDDHNTMVTSAGLDFTNSGGLDVDGGATLSLGGTLRNSGRIDVLTSGDHGNYSTASGTTTITANALSNTGSIRLWGNTADKSQAIMDIAGSAPTTWTGSGSVLGYSLLEFASGGITSIAQGASLFLYGPNERIALASDATTNSALNGLVSNAGTLDLENGALLTLSSGNFTNTGHLSIDVGGGGSNVNFDGLTNTSIMQVGFFTNVVATSIVTASALENTGTLIVEGYEYGGIIVGPKMTVSGATVNSGTIETFGVSLIDFVGAVSGTGTVEIGNRGCVIEFGAAVGSSQKVTFLSGGPGASLPPQTLELDDPAEFAATISGLSVGSSATTAINQVDLTTIASSDITAASLDASSDILTVSTTGSGTFPIQLSGSYATGTYVDWKADAGGTGSDLFLSTVPCFCRGTMILTPEGEVPVEALAIGDRVTTLSGQARAIKWIGHRAYHPRFVVANRKVLPIKIEAGALAYGLPARDLWVSPEHALYVRGLLVPAQLLANGATIRQVERVDGLEYFHIELDTHDLLLAEQAPAESYIDCDNRGMFHNSHEFARLYPDDTSRQGQFCVPRAVEGSADLTAIRRMMLARARVFNRLTRDPDLHLLVDGTIVRPEAATHQTVCRFVIPRCPAFLSIASRTAVPAEIEISSVDHRRLGVALERIVLHGSGRHAEIAHYSPLLSDGFHRDEPTHRWTDGLGHLSEDVLRPFRGAALLLELHLMQNGMCYPISPPVGPGVYRNRVA